MMVITAVYENGLLRPLTPLNLTDRQTVRLQVLPADASIEDEGAAAVRVLVAAGLMRPRAEAMPPAPLSDVERRELAHRLGQTPGKPLSEIIIEDRGERSCPNARQVTYATAPYALPPAP